MSEWIIERDAAGVEVLDDVKTDRTVVIVDGFVYGVYRGETSVQDACRAADAIIIKRVHG